MTPALCPVKTNTDLEAYRRLLRDIYAHDRHYTPHSEMLPCDGSAWLAYDGNTPVACCAAQTQTANPNIGTIGFFESINHPPTAKVLLGHAVALLRSAGAQRIIGPMNGDTWHAYRINAGPFEAAPFLKEPWNPPYYSALWEKAGFVRLESYGSFIVDDPALAASNQLKYYRRCVQHGYTFVPITGSNYTSILQTLHALSTVIFSNNLFYTPIGYESFANLYATARPLLRHGLSWLSFLPNGSPAGYVFAYPDYADAVRAMRGRSDVFAKIRFLLGRHRATRTCIKTLGVIPEARGSGLAMALTHLAFANSANLGYRQCLMCLMHSANASQRLGGQADRPFRSYVLYDYQP